MNTTSCSNCNNSSPSPTPEALVGWALESSGRGTLSLIATCLFTISLCTWVVIHPRVHQRPRVRRLHKLVLFLKTIFAPEFIAVEGLQEWTQARRMMRTCAGWTGGDFKLVHAFYIGMLALKYRTPEGSRVMWPNQYTWLLEQRLIDWKHHGLWGLAEDEIRDKSNADDLVKLAALCQVSWFVAQSIMRTAHALPLSPLESMALSYVPLFAATYFFWWLKPKDILTPSVIDLPEMLPAQRTTFESLAVSSTFDDEGVGRQESLWSVWFLTPRVFEREAADKALRDAEQTASRGANGEDDESRCFEVLPVEQKPEGTVVAWWDPDLYHSRLWPITCLFGASFPALHLICWDTVFPTLVEQWLWRATALVSVVSMLIFMQFEKVVFRWGGPLTIVSILSPALYLISRVVMIGGVIAALRASHPATYDTYVVSTYWVHIL
ncbi:MAG: hypothetical protein M1817_004314 [Caeruleum heppii]|nr:MAG: hypothetical protein M1817_004314 [Caeruleum heppii]